MHIEYLEQELMGLQLALSPHRLSLQQKPCILE